MIRHFIKLLDPFDERAHDSLLFLEDADVAVDLCVAKLVIVEVPKCCRYLVLALMVEEHVERARVIVDFELCAHRLLDPAEQSACQDDVVDGISVELADVVRSGL